MQMRTTSLLHLPARVTCVAEDPLWWSEQEVALLGGTRLEIAVKEHQKIVAKLTSWRDRLVQFQR